jgi:hypothetical protein
MRREENLYSGKKNTKWGNKKKKMGRKSTITIDSDVV